MSRFHPVALALATLLVAPMAAAQSAAPEDAPAVVEAQIQASIGRAGVPVRPATPAAPPPSALPADLPDEQVPAAVEARILRGRMNPPGTPPGGVPAAAPLVPDDVPDEDVPARFEEAIRARQREAAGDLRGAPAEPAPPRDEGASLAPAPGRVHLSLGTTHVRGTARARTSQNVVVEAAAALDVTAAATLEFTGADDQTVDTPLPLTVGNLALDKTAGEVILADATTVSGTLNLADDLLFAAADLTVSGTVLGTGGVGFEGGGSQLFTMSGPLSLGNLYLRKSAGTVTLSQPLTVTGELENDGTATLAGDVTVAGTGALALAGGTLTLGADLDVYGVVEAAGGALARNGFALRLAPTTSGGPPATTVDRLAAVAGDGSTVGDAFLYERPYLDGEGWRMVAAPFAAVLFSTLNDDFHTQGATGADVPNGDPNVLRWVPANAPGSRYVGVTDFTQPFTPGTGYFLYAYATDPVGGSPILPTTWDVEGLEPAGSVITPLSYSGEDAERRWNLLGNPYAAPIDWHAVQTEGDFQASYAVWDPAANGGLGNYAYYSTTGVSTGRANRYVPAFQGFWAEATISSPFGLTFDRVWKAPTESPVYAGRAEGVAELRLHLEGEGLEATEPVALFLDGAASGPDVYDGAWLRPMSPDYAAAFFVRDGGGGPPARLVFEARPATPDATPLGLAVEATRSGTYTLSWPGLEAAPAGPLTLVDLVTGASVDMRAVSGYTFTMAANAAPTRPGALPALGGAASPRFTMTFGLTTAGAGAPAVPAALALAARPNPLADRAVVRYGLPSAGAVRVSVYDALGREVAVLASGERAAGWHEAPLAGWALAAGVYVVRLEAGGEVLTRRLTVAR